MFATPIAYPSSLLREPWRTVYALNPMVGVVEGFRWALLGEKQAPGAMLWVSVLVVVGLPGLAGSNVTCRPVMSTAVHRVADRHETP